MYMYQNSVFLAGNLEAQRLSRSLTPRDKYLFVKRHFIYSCLLSENVYFPAANYFQSTITEKLVNEFAPLFRATDTYPQLVHIAINPSKENFRGEALEKKDTYLDLPDYKGYMDDITRERLVTNLNNITTPFMRKGKLINSINDYICKETKKGGFLNISVSKFTDSQEETHKIFRPLIMAVNKNEKAIIPEYIMQFDDSHVINTAFEQMIRLSLLKAYSESLEKHYSSYVCNPLIHTYNYNYIFPYEINFLDTYLFWLFIRLFDDIETKIINITPDELRRIKYSERFRVFIEGYRKFVLELCKKSVSFFELQQEVALEKTVQDRMYINTLKNIITDTQLASLMYKAMYGIKAKLKKFFGLNVIKMDTLIEVNEKLFLYALVDEIYESFLNRYNVLLMEKVRQSYKQNKERRSNIMFNRMNISIGGTQTVVSKSKNINVITQTVSDEKILLSETEIQQILSFADKLSGYNGSKLKQSEKIKLSASLYEISENVADVNKCSEKVGVFRTVFDTLDDIGKKTVVSIAAGILSKIILNLLGLA